MSEDVVVLENVWKIFGDRAPDAMDAIQQRGLSKPEVLEEFECVVGIADCSFKVQRGEIFCVMGLSGYMLALKGDALREMRARHIGMVFQHMALLPHRTVRDNVAFPLQVRGEPKSKRWEVSQRCLDMVNLEGYEDRFPRELSGGMQQRVGLARALASELSAELNKTTVFITHDLDEAIRIGHRIAIMKDGRIVQIGTAEEIVTNPSDDYVRDFVEGISRLKLVFAHTIMKGLDEHIANGGVDLSQAPRVPHATDLDHLIDMASVTEHPLVVQDDQKTDIGVIDKTTLLKGIQGGKG